MKKLYSSPQGFMGHLAGQSVTGEVSYALVETTHPDIRLKASRNQLRTLDYEFPDSATNERYRQIYNGCEDANKAAVIYLNELAEQGLIPKPEPEPEKKVKAPITKPATK